jgi:hypothetical protein
MEASALNHAGLRAIERYGETLTPDEQFGMLRRIRKGGAVPLKRRKSQFPGYLVCWDRIGKTIAIITTPTRRQVVTVLPDDCWEVRKAFRRWFG